MAFHDIRLPVDVEKGALGGPGFHTEVTPLASGKEQRNINWARPRGEWDVGYGIMVQVSEKVEADMDTIIAFFYAREGKAHGFRFKDWSDFKIGDFDNPTVTNQSIGTGDAVDSTFACFKRYTSGGINYDRPVTHLVTGRIAVLIDDVVKTDPGDYTIDLLTGLITFASPPADMVDIQIALEFDIPVRFDTDRLDINLTMFERGSWENIPILELKQDDAE